MLLVRDMMLLIRDDVAGTKKLQELKQRAKNNTLSISPYDHSSGFNSFSDRSLIIVTRLFRKCPLKNKYGASCRQC